MEVMGGSVHTGSVDGLAQGDVLVDAVFDGTDDKVLETRARVLGGGVSATQPASSAWPSPRTDASVRISTLIGKAINQPVLHVRRRREEGRRRSASATTSSTWRSSPRYKHNLARYLRVIRNIAAPRNARRAARAACSCWKRSCWSRASAAAGGDAARSDRQRGSRRARSRAWRRAIPEVRFYAAEALAYLDQPEAAAPLGQAARDESAFRWHALTALADDDARLGPRRPERAAARARASRPATAPSARCGSAMPPIRRRRASCSTESSATTSIATTGEPLIHVARSRMPEIVVFGHEQRLKPPKLPLRRQAIMVTAPGKRRAQGRPLPARRRTRL